MTPLISNELVVTRIVSAQLLTLALIISNNLLMAPIKTIPQHGPAIRALRLKDGLSVGGFAELVGCAQSAISNIELERKQPSEQMLNRIARALHVPVAAISREPFAAENDADAELQQSA